MKASLQYLTMGGIILFASCQKVISSALVEDNVAGNGIQAVSSRITGGDWKFTSVKLEYDNGEIDEGPLDECKSDDLYRYEANGDATVVHGSIPCSVDDGDGKFANWELIKNGMELKEVYTRDLLGETSGSVVVYKVEFISNHKLTISRIVNEGTKIFTEFNTYTK